MLSYTGRRNLFGTLINDTSSATLTVGDTLMNAAEKRILAMRDWPFLEKLDTTLTTTASTQAYTLPQRVSKPKSIYVTVSSVRYVPEEITSRDQWDRQNVISYTSDFPVYYYIFGRTISLWPTPASSSNTIGIIYRNTAKDLSIADYTTGGVASVAAAGTAVVGTGTTWTASMAGRYLRITESDTALKGDGYWYEVASSASATALTLVNPYGGTAIAAGNAAYIIGQMSLLPEGYTDLPVFAAIAQYFTSIQPNMFKAGQYTQLYNDLLKQMIADQGDKSSSPVLDPGNSNRRFTNPNLTITL